MKKRFWCDFYHLTTAQTLFLEGMHETKDVFEAYIRSNPFGGGYTMVAGLAIILNWINNWGYPKSGIKKLARLKNPDGSQQFGNDFLEYIYTQPCKLTIDAIPEGELVFPNEPIYRIRGPKWQVLMVETAVLNAMNASSLIATKASRVKYAANGKTVMEFGLRRMQEIYGVNVTRSAIIGGADFTSNVDAGLEYNLPLAGTHPHAYVMSFEKEYDAFLAWMKHNPFNKTVLTDTYNTKKGFENAISAAKVLNFDFISGRLDSGDLNKLSNQTRNQYNDANMPNSKVIASNDLDEYKIDDLERNGGKIDIYGVGTAMVTANDQPALGGVYKIKESAGVDKIKFSEDAIKTTIPGATDIIRMLDKDGKFVGDVIISAKNSFSEFGTLEYPIISICEKTGQKMIFDTGHSFYKPLTRVVDNGIVTGKKLMKKPVIKISSFAKENLNRLDDSCRQLKNPKEYFVGLESYLFEKRKNLIEQNQR